MVGTNAAAETKLRDFERELQHIERDLLHLQGVLHTHPHDLEKRTRLLYRLYHRATLTERTAAFDPLEPAIRDALNEFGPQEDLCLLRANLNFRFHRVAQARENLEIAPLLPNRFEARTLLADLDFQEGRYEQARAGYERLIQENRTWDNLARLAHFKSKFGDFDGADSLYEEAQDELTAKEMRSYAWVEVQRGVLDITRGRYDEAEAHYDRCVQAYSGYPYFEQHVAELLGAQGRFEESIALFERVIESTGKPELMQTLGELYRFIERPEPADAWFQRALDGYLQFASRQEVHYFHHLTDFYSEVNQDGAEALKWATRDIQLRENFSTQAALAWALYLNGQVQEAWSSMEAALASGAQDAEMFVRAGAIQGALGNPTEAERYVQMADELNPRHDNFHMHR